jgi:hypothetical protein
VQCDDSNLALATLDVRDVPSVHIQVKGRVGLSPTIPICGRPGQCRPRGPRRARNLGGAGESSRRDGKAEGARPGRAAEIFPAATGGL